MDFWFELKGDFTCSRRRDGSILINAKMEENKVLAERNEICDVDITVARDSILNLATGTAMKPSLSLITRQI